MGRWRDAEHEYEIRPIWQPAKGIYSAVVITVVHREFVTLGTDGMRALCKPESVIYDVKCVLSKGAAGGRL